MLLNGVATHREHGNYVDSFRRVFRSDWEKKGKGKVRDTFLIGTTGIMGTSMTLNVAKRMVLNCCLYVLRDEEQVYARIDRMGN